MAEGTNQFADFGLRADVTIQRGTTAGLIFHSQYKDDPQRKCYEVRLSTAGGGTVALVRLDDGAPTTIASAAYPLAAGERHRAFLVSYVAGGSDWAHVGYTYQVRLDQAGALFTAQDPTVQRRNTGYMGLAVAGAGAAEFQNVTYYQAQEPTAPTPTDTPTDTPTATATNTPVPTSTPTYYYQNPFTYTPLPAASATGGPPAPSATGAPGASATSTDGPTDTPPPCCTEPPPTGGAHSNAQSQAATPQANPPAYAPPVAASTPAVGAPATTDSARSDPETAPYLDMTYGTQSSASPSSTPNPTPVPAPPYTYFDGARSIGGIAGTFAASANYSQQSSSCPQSSDVCHQAIKVDAIRGFNAQYIRVGITLKCTAHYYDKPGYAWWSSFGLLKDPQGAPTPNGSPFNPNSIYQTLANAYDDHLIPIIDINQDDNCPGNDDTASQMWNTQVKDFVNSMPADVFSKFASAGMTYFEIGNEENYKSAYDYGRGEYVKVFKCAALGLQDALRARQGNHGNYRILVYGVLHPTADESMCPQHYGANDYSGYTNLDYATYAINYAEDPHDLYGNPTEAVDPVHLGVAMHPYGYDTDQYDYGTRTGFWRNYYTEYGTGYDQYGTTSYSNHNQYAGVCSDLEKTLNLWTHDSSLGGLPLIFTEDNYTDSFKADSPQCHYDVGSIAGCEGTYAADLFTWLDDNNWAQSNPDGIQSPIRVMWFRGTNAPGGDDPAGNDGHGLYTGGGDYKSVQIDYCPYLPDSVQGQHYLSDVFRRLVDVGTNPSGCYKYLSSPPS